VECSIFLFSNVAFKEFFLKDEIQFLFKRLFSEGFHNLSRFPKQLKLAQSPFKEAINQVIPLSKKLTRLEWCSSWYVASGIILGQNNEL